MLKSNTKLSVECWRRKLGELGTISEVPSPVRAQIPKTDFK